MRSLVLGTAGHIDHGKSAIVRALTGTDPDRLKEERLRGITIDLGFAHLDAGGVTLAFIDVPGHERFVRNMLAGAGGIDAVLLVVAADESVRPQTREHFDICRLIGVDRGVIALSKADLADPGVRAVTELEVRELVAGSFLARARVVPVSARTGEGLDALREALVALAGGPPRQGRDGAVRLPVDRVFTVRGFGTVVTGTLVSGRVAEGDALAALPEGRLVRVRGVQTHGRAVPAAEAPGRVALNLGAIAVEALGRGVTLATPDTLAVTRRVDGRLVLLGDAAALAHGTRVRVHHGTAETPGRVAISATRQAAGDPWRPARAGEAAVGVAPGGEAYVRVRFERPVVLTRGDRLVVRAGSPPRTIAGVTVLDPEPPAAGIRRPGALERFERLEADADRLWLAEAGPGGVGRAALVRRGGLGLAAAGDRLAALVSSGAASMVGDRGVDAGALRTLTEGVLAALAAFHRERPDQAGMPREEVRVRVAPGAPPAVFDAAVRSLESTGRVRGADRLSLSDHRPAVAAEVVDAQAVVEARIREAGLTPPDPGALGPALGLATGVIERALQGLLRDGRVVRAGLLVFHRDALAALRQDVQSLRAAAGPAARIDVAAFKTRYGLTRKFAIPLLEWLDRERVTRRAGEARIIL